VFTSVAVNPANSNDVWMVRVDDVNMPERKVKSNQSRIWSIPLPSAHIFAEEASGTETGSARSDYIENYRAAESQGINFAGDRFAQGASRKVRIATPGYDDFHFYTPRVFVPDGTRVYTLGNVRRRVEEQDTYRTLGGKHKHPYDGEEMFNRSLPRTLSREYFANFNALSEREMPPMNVWYSYYPAQINNNVHMFVRTNFLSEHQESKYFQGPGRRTQNPEGTVATDILGVVPADARFLQWDNVSGYAGPSSNGYFQTINMPEIREIQVKITDEKNRALSEGLIDDDGEKSQNPEIMLGIRFDKIRNPDFSRAGRISDTAERSLHHPEAISLKGKPV
jgi:hypothetical protein